MSEEGVDIRAITERREWTDGHFRSARRYFRGPIKFRTDVKKKTR